MRLGASCRSSRCQSQTMQKKLNNNKFQVGGFKLKFDLRRPRLDRLVLAEVGSCKLYMYVIFWFGLHIFHQVPCDDCPLQYEPIKDDQLYKVINDMIFY